MVGSYEITVTEAFTGLDVKVWGPETLKTEAQIACALLERIIADPNALRQEAVDRACGTAQLAMEAFRNRGWVVPLPNPDEARALMRKED